MPPKHAICTVITRNYLPYARTLCESFHAHNPGHAAYVLVIDDFDSLIRPAEEDFEVLGAGTLGIPDFYPHHVFKYNNIEISCMLKPYCMEKLLLDYGVERLLYLDSDIFVTSALDSLYESLDRHDILLTPHLDTDFPDDNCRPDIRDILKVGTFNLGFIGAANRTNALEILRWWKQKVSDHCVIDFPNGYYLDQKFFDLAVTLFEGIHAEKDPGLNVGHWNLHSRRITQVDGVWLANGSPLRFFHFSGTDPHDCPKISTYTTRYDLTTRPELAPLFAEYRARLLANGYDEMDRWHYQYSRFDTGDPIPGSIRRAYRNDARLRKETLDPFCLASIRKEWPALPEMAELNPPRWRVRAKTIVKSSTPPLIWQALRAIRRMRVETNGGVTAAEKT